MWTPTLGAQVLISSAGAYHNGHTGIVTAQLTGASLIAIGDCRHWFTNYELRPVPQPDAIPEPVNPDE